VKIQRLSLGHFGTVEVKNQKLLKVVKSVIRREHYLFTSMSSIIAGYWLLFCFLVIVYCALIEAMCSCWIHIIPTYHTLHFYEFLGLHNGVVVSVPMGCAATSLGKWCPIF
jgi:hypothetical protein